LICFTGATHRASIEIERIVIAIPIAYFGCNMGLRMALSHERARVLFALLHGASNRIRVMSSGGGSTSAADSMNRTAAAESRASSAHAGHSPRCRSSSNRSAELSVA